MGNSRDEVFRRIRELTDPNYLAWGKLNLSASSSRNGFESDGHVETNAIEIETSSALLRSLIDGSSRLYGIIVDMSPGEKHCVYQAFKPEYWEDRRNHRTDPRAGASGEMRVYRSQKRVRLSGKYVCWDKEFELEFHGKLGTILENCINRQGKWTEDWLHVDGDSGY